MREKLKRSARNDRMFFRVVPEILIYQVITKIMLFVIVMALKQNALLVLYHTGRSALTSGDLPFLLRTKGGIVLVLIGIIVLVVYTVFDVNAMFILADSVLYQRKKSWWIVLKEAFVSLKYFTHPQGLFVTLYLSLLGPLIGTAVGFSFMVGFSAPNFVLTYISSKPWLRALVIFGVMLYVFVAGIYVFTILNVVFQKEKINVAMKSSRKMVTENWRVFLFSMLIFLLKAFLIGLVLFVGLYGLPLNLIRMIPLSVEVSRTLKIFSLTVFSLVYFTYPLLLCPFLAIRITTLYKSFSGEKPVDLGERDYKIGWKRVAVVLALAIGLFSVYGAINFDEVFPISNNTKIVAHRAGGNLGTENTLSALQQSIDHKIPVAEIDVQRTLDGKYIVCHDSNLKKTTGREGNPTELTLQEVKSYSLKNHIYPWEEGEKISTLEEMLDASKGKIELFLELKGATADKQMVRDVYQMLKERDMVSTCTMICFNYDLIEYIEEVYPEVETGYLVYFSFGNLEELDCDTYIVETECLSSDEINRIHASGKKVGVWTVNTSSELNRWLLTPVDYVITDEVLTAKMLKKYIYNGEDEVRIIQTLLK